MPRRKLILAASALSLTFIAGAFLGYEAAPKPNPGMAYRREAAGLRSDTFRRSNEVSLLQAQRSPTSDPAVHRYKLQVAWDSGQGHSFSGSMTSGDSASSSFPSTLFEHLPQMPSAPLGLRVDLLPPNFGPGRQEP